jgi:hypothetical protein
MIVNISMVQEQNFGVLQKSNFVTSIIELEVDDD